MDETAVADFYDEPVNVGEAQETLKRNLPPAGNYVTMLEDYEPTVTPVAVSYTHLTLPTNREV